MQRAWAINGRFMSRLPDYRRFIEQRYDFSCGELTTQFQFSVDGVTARCETVTFCSRSMPSLVLQQLAVTVDGACIAPGGSVAAIAASKSFWG